jgi:hypothetical protein
MAANNEKKAGRNEGHNKDKKQATLPSLKWTFSQPDSSRRNLETLEQRVDLIHQAGWVLASMTRSGVHTHNVTSLVSQRANTDQPPACTNCKVKSRFEKYDIPEGIL